MLMDPDPSQQHAGFQHAVWQLPQKVTRPKARFKPTLPMKSGVDGGANQVQKYLGQSLHLYSLLSPPICPMMQRPVQPYIGLSPSAAVVKTGVPGGKTTAKKPLSTTGQCYIVLRNRRWVNTKQHQQFCNRRFLTPESFLANSSLGGVTQSNKLMSSRKKMALPL